MNGIWLSNPILGLLVYYWSIYSVLKSTKRNIFIWLTFFLFFLFLMAIDSTTRADDIIWLQSRYSSKGTCEDPSQEPSLIRIWMAWYRCSTKSWMGTLCYSSVSFCVCVVRIIIQFELVSYSRSLSNQLNCIGDSCISEILFVSIILIDFTSFFFLL